MEFLPLKRRRIKKPSTNNVQLKGKYKSASMCCLNNGSLIDMTGQVTPAFGGTGGTFSASRGMRNVLTDTNNYINYGAPDSLGFTLNDSVTILSVFKVVDTANHRTLYRNGDSQVLFRVNSSDNINILWGDFPGDIINITGTTTINGETVYAVAFTRHIGLDLNVVSINGKTEVSQADPLTSAFTMSTNWQSQYEAGNSERFEGERYLDVILPFGMSEAEVNALTANPWQIFEPQTQFIDITQAASTVASLIPIYRRQTKKPNNPTGIDKSHPLAQNLKAFIVPIGDQLVDLVSGEFGVQSNTTPSTSGGEGRTVDSVNASSSTVSFASLQHDIGTGPLSAVMRYAATNAQVNTWYAGFSLPNNSDFTAYMPRNFWPGSRVYVETGGAGGSEFATQMTTDTTFSTYAFTCSDGSGSGQYVAGYKNGVSYGDTTNLMPYTEGGTTGLNIFHINSSNSADGTLSYFMLFNGELSAAEVKALHDNPWQVLENETQWINIGTATGATAYTLTAESGSYSITGTDVGTLWSRLVTAEAGSYTMTGADAGVLHSRLITAESGSYTMTGQDASLLKSYTLVGESGSYTLTGTLASLLHDRVLVMEPGAYTVTGQDATLTYTPLGTMYTITAESGAYAITGSDVTLLYDRVLTAESGSYVVTGQFVTLLYSGAGAGGATAISGNQMVTTKQDTSLPLEVIVDQGGGVSGLTVLARIRDPLNSSSYLDFDDMTFKTSGWVDDTLDLSDFGGGFYGTTLDVTAITNLPTGKSLSVEYTVSGSVNAVTQHNIYFIDDYLTTGKFLGLK